MDTIYDGLVSRVVDALNSGRIVLLTGIEYERETELKKILETRGYLRLNVSSNSNGNVTISNTNIAAEIRKHESEKLEGKTYPIPTTLIINAST